MICHTNYYILQGFSETSMFIQACAYQPTVKFTSSVNLHSSLVHYLFPNFFEATPGPSEHQLPCPKCHQRCNHTCSCLNQSAVTQFSGEESREEE